MNKIGFGQHFSGLTLRETRSAAKFSLTKTTSIETQARWRWLTAAGWLRRQEEGQSFSSFLRLMALSSVTDDKIFNRYGECGLDGPEDRSRRPYRQATELPFQIEHCILGLKRELSSWRAPKIRDKLIREYPMLKYEP